MVTSSEGSSWEECWKWIEADRVGQEPQRNTETFWECPCWRPEIPEKGHFWLSLDWKWAPLPRAIFHHIIERMTGYWLGQFTYLSLGLSYLSPISVVNPSLGPQPSNSFIILHFLEPLLLCRGSAVPSKCQTSNLKNFLSKTQKKDDNKVKFGAGKNRNYRKEMYSII